MKVRKRSEGGGASRLLGEPCTELVLYGSGGDDCLGEEEHAGGGGVEPMEHVAGLRVMVRAGDEV